MALEIGNYVYNPKKIGRGSFSQVFKGYNKITNEKVAVKQIDLFTMKNCIHLLKREIDIMRSVNHPNILKLVDVVPDKNNEYLYLIIEYCRHGDLAAYINQKPFNETYARKYMRQLISALKYLRKNKIMHRDIKPHNILLYNKDTIKLSDFGFAKVYEEHTLMDTICGSPLYMAPEICSQNYYNDKSDLWSIGVLLYEMVTGTPPYVGRSQVEIVHKIMKEEFSFPDNIKLSGECKDLICKLLQKDCVHRIDWDELFNHIWLLTSVTVLEENMLIECALSPSRPPAPRPATPPLPLPADSICPAPTVAGAGPSESQLMFNIEIEQIVNTTPYQSALAHPYHSSSSSSSSSHSHRIQGISSEFEILPDEVFYKSVVFRQIDGFTLVDISGSSPSSLPNLNVVSSFMNSSIGLIKRSFSSLITKR